MNPGQLSNTLQSGEFLLPGQFLISNNGLYGAIMQLDGNFVLYPFSGQQAYLAPNGPPIWATGTVRAHFSDPAIFRVIMQPDGNLVVYDCIGSPQWASGTVNHQGSTLVCSEDGHLYVLDPTQTKLAAYP